MVRVMNWSVAAALLMASVKGFMPSVNTVSVTNNQQRASPSLDALGSFHVMSGGHDTWRLYANNVDNDSAVDRANCWNPTLRRIMASIATVGVAETTYLTYDKLVGNNGITTFCSETADCTSVLNGPYSILPGTSIPVSALGLLAYSTVLILSLAPLLQNGSDDSDSQNRVLLTALTTGMGVFSVFLMSLLFGVLKTTCPFCEVSAVLSVLLASLSVFGGALPQQRIREGTLASIATSLTSFGVAAVLFVGGGMDTNGGMASSIASVTSAPSTSVVTTKGMGEAPPPIQSKSTPRTLEIANKLKALDVHFYGAFWCSHCYDQKEALGKEAMALIPYIECSKDGLNSQTTLCKEKNIPGYPTWEINGKLYPGEQALEELEGIIQENR